MARIIWSKELVDHEIQKYIESGLPLYTTDVRKVNNKLVTATRNFYGSWNDALKHFGINLNRKAVNKRVSWSRDKIIEEIRKLADEGVDVSGGVIQTKYYPLYRAARRFFGQWNDALLASGINPEEYSKVTKWTKEKLKDELKRIYDEHGDLSGTFLQSIGMSTIPVMSKKIFGSYDDALVEAGFIPSDIHRKKAFWTEREIELKIKEVYEESNDISKEFFKKEHSGLVGYCERMYGGWYHTLKHFGYSTDGIRVHWKEPRQILDELRRKDSSMESLAHTDVSNSLYLAASRRFGGWDNALREAGIDPEKHRKYNRWTREKFLDRIKEHYNQGTSMLNSAIFQVDSALASSYTMYFNSWEEFLHEAEIFDYNFSNNTDKTILGYQFQFLLKRVFFALGINVESEKTHGNLRPDFTLNNTTWIDAKLSSWTALSDGTLSKYGKAIDFLLIVYLRGNDIEGTQKVNFVPVDDFFPALISKGYSSLVEQIVELREAADLADKAS